VIFHGVTGFDDREERSPSFFNLDEVEVVVDYVEKLMDCKNPTVGNKDIGIISPYHQQVSTPQSAIRISVLSPHTTNKLVPHSRQ